MIALVLVLFGVRLKTVLHLHFTFYVHVTLNGFCGFSSKYYVNSSIAKVIMRGHWQSNLLSVKGSVGDLLHVPLWDIKNEKMCVWDHNKECA